MKKTLATFVLAAFVVSTGAFAADMQNAAPAANNGMSNMPAKVMVHKDKKKKKKKAKHAKHSKKSEAAPAAAAAPTGQ